MSVAWLYVSIHLLVIGYCSFIITPDTGECEKSKFVLLEYHVDTSIPFAF